MDDSVKRYRQRRDARLKARAVMTRKDDDDESAGGGNGANTRLPYGLAKSKGIDTTGMSPPEVWQALESEGVSASAEYKKLAQRRAQKKMEANKFNKFLNNGWTQKKTAPPGSIKGYANQPTETMEGDMKRQGYKKNSLGRWVKG